MRSNFRRRPERQTHVGALQQSRGCCYVVSRSNNRSRRAQNICLPNQSIPEHQCYNWLDKSFIEPPSSSEIDSALPQQGVAPFSSHFVMDFVLYTHAQSREKILFLLAARPSFIIDPFLITSQDEGKGEGEGFQSNLQTTTRGTGR